MTTTPIYDEELLSDLHKGARGYRPREMFWIRWKDMTVSERNAEWQTLCEEVEASTEEDRAQERAAVASYEGRLEELQELGALDRETAIAWLIDSLRGPDYCWQDPDEVCYDLGLPFTMRTEFQGWYDRVMKLRWANRNEGRG